MSISSKIGRPIITTALVISSLLIFGTSAIADEVVPVNVDNFVRAETAKQADGVIKMAGGINQWFHFRKPAALDKQIVLRINRDTLYSVAVVDISEGATLTLPNTGKRYMSVMVVTEDNYINKVYHKGGTYKLTMKEFKTPYVLLTVRTLVDSLDPKDIEEVNKLQNQMKIKAVSAKPYTHPNYDKKSYEATFKTLVELGKGLPDAKHFFGKKEDVTETRHLIGTAYGYGGLSEQEAFYLNKGELRKAGDFQLTVKDVPVDGFWSISIYNKDGYFEQNKFNSNSINNLIAKPNKDGSITVNFGTNPEGKENFLYVMDGWNYVVRHYQPRKEVLNGEWTFPEPQPVK
jgi:hypothetical protein